MNMRPEVVIMGEVERPGYRNCVFVQDNTQIHNHYYPAGAMVYRSPWGTIFWGMMTVFVLTGLLAALCK